MLTEDRISMFYEDLASLGLKRPVADIAKATGFSKGNVSQYINRKSTPSENFIEKFYVAFKESFKKVPRGPQKETQDVHQTSPGYVPAQDLIEVLKQQNEFLRRNFETSLITILVGQKQIGAQIKGLTWYHASAVNKGDQDGIEKDLLETNNMIAAYQGAGVEGDNSETGNTKSIGGKRQSKR